MVTQTDGADRRLLLLAPTSRDAETSRALLSEAGVKVDVCTTVDGLLRELSRGAAAILVPEEAVGGSNAARIRAVLSAQPPWSDLPVLVLARAGADSVESGEAVRTLGNVTLLERPVRVATLVSAVRTALRGRDRQYQIREHLHERVRAADALRDADQRKDEFLATLGHELRNPLQPLLTGLLELQVASAQDPTVRRVVTMMQRQISHLVRLVDDLLEVSRITRGIIDVQHDPVDLATLLRAAIDTSRPVIDAAGHELRVEMPAEPMTVIGDAVRLSQVFANLLTNAAKYTNPGGHIWLTARRAGNSAVVTVRDDGIGIPAEHLGSVFDMFMQVDRSNRRVQGGLGIGLTLVRSLVAMHGGSVNACSDGHGKGSSFVVTLPAQAQSAHSEDRSTTPRRLPHRRILVVDDNRDAGDSLGTLLTALGSEVSVVRSGRAALDALDGFAPDTILLDIGMPDMDGYEVARRIRVRPRHAQTLLVALTGWGQDRDIERSRAAGFDHHLVKPPNIEKLFAILSERAAV